jgi:hypothetical protein
VPLSPTFAGQSLVPVPFFFKSSVHTLFRPSAQELATRWACREAQTPWTRRLYAAFVKTGRFSTESFKSIARNLRRNQAQNFSTALCDRMFQHTHDRRSLRARHAVTHIVECLRWLPLSGEAETSRMHLLADHRHGLAKSSVRPPGG